MYKQKEQLELFAAPYGGRSGAASSGSPFSGGNKGKSGSREVYVDPKAKEYADQALAGEKAAEELKEAAENPHWTKRSGGDGTPR